MPHGTGVASATRTSQVRKSLFVAISGTASGNVRPGDGYPSGVTEEKDGGSGAMRRGPADLVWSTVALQLAGLAFCGVVALIAWPFGWLPDSQYLALMSTMFAAQPAGELYRAGPPRRLAAVAALFTLMTVALLIAATAEWAFPVMAEHDLGFLAGFLVGTPVGVAVLAWFYNRGNVA